MPSYFLTGAALALFTWFTLSLSVFGPGETSVADVTTDHLNTTGIVLIPGSMCAVL